jgi:hypothetical protein
MMRVVRRVVPFLGKLLLVVGLFTVLVAIVTIGWFRHHAEDSRPAAVSVDVAMPRGTRAIELWFPEASGHGLALETREVKNRRRCARHHGRNPVTASMATARTVRT